MPRHSGVHLIEIEGPSPVSAETVAEAVSPHTAEAVMLVAARPDSVAPTFRALGISEDAAAFSRAVVIAQYQNPTTNRSHGLQLRHCVTRSRRVLMADNPPAASHNAPH